MEGKGGGNKEFWAFVNRLYYELLCLISTSKYTTARQQYCCFYA